MKIKRYIVGKDLILTQAGHICLLPAAKPIS